MGINKRKAKQAPAEQSEREPLPVLAQVVSRIVECANALKNAPVFELHESQQQTIIRTLSSNPAFGVEEPANFSGLVGTTELLRVAKEFLTAYDAVVGQHFNEVAHEISPQEEAGEKADAGSGEEAGEGSASKQPSQRQSARRKGR